MSETPPEERERSGPPGSWLERAARRAVRRSLSATRAGELSVEEGGRTDRFGSNEGQAEPLRGRIEVRDPGFWSRIARRGALGAAEAWMDGLWTSDDLPSVLRVAARNAGMLRGLNSGVARLAHPGLRLLHAARANSRRGSRRNIEAHYDLGDDFFELFLDETWTYSCAFFERPDASLAQAQAAKYERVARKLDLRPDDRVLEVGGGWGGFALHAAGRYGCRVTSITVSPAQYERARERVARAGLGGRVEILMEDYRDVSGTYDKLASIEMIEAVGHRYLPAYVRALGERLAPDGVAALQAITLPEQVYAASVGNVDFVKRYVFPGGQLVSLGALLRAVRSETDLRLLHLEDLSDHYVRTLRLWRERFLARAERVRELGYGERFRRMWDYYLAYCEAGFAERATGLCQVVLERGGGRRPSPTAGFA